MISLDKIKTKLLNLKNYKSLKNKVDLEKLRARIEIVREGIILSPSDQTLEKGLNLLVSDVTAIFYKDGLFFPFTEKKLSLVTSLCRSLVEISDFTSRHNRGIYFSSQRLLHNISFYLLSHPDYEKLFRHSWDSNTEDRVEITRILYDLAERQNMNPRPTGDVTAEGEFSGRIFDIINYKIYSITPNKVGLKDAFQLWKDHCRSSATINPSRLKYLYENLRDAATHNYIHDIDRPYIYPEPAWFQDWLSLFVKLKPSIYMLEDYQDAYNSLNGIQANGEWASISIMAKNSVFQEISSWKLEDIQAACIQSTALNSIGYLFGVIALYGRWRELKDCWYSTQPVYASALFCSHDFFNRNLPSFCNWMIANIAEQDDAVFFVGRHSLNKNILKACIVLVADELNSNTLAALPMASNSVVEINKAVVVVQGLLLHVELIEDVNVRLAFDWKDSSDVLRNKVDLVLKNTLDNLNSNLSKALLACIPCPTDPEDLEIKYGAWGETNEKFIEELDPSSWGKNVFSKTALAEMTHLGTKKEDVGASYYLSKNSQRRLFDMNFGGRELARILKERIGFDLQYVVKREGVLPVNDRVKIFLSKNDLDCYGFNKIIDKLGRNYNYSGIIKGDFESSFIVSPGSIELKVYQWPDMPWSFDDKPVVIYGFLDLSERIKSNSSIYYKLKVINPLGVYKLNFE